VPEYVGMPPPTNVAPDRYVHNPYGYVAAHPHTPEEFYHHEMHHAVKVDPSAAVVEP